VRPGKPRLVGGPPRGNDAPGLTARKTAASILRQVLERGVPLDALIDEAHGTTHFRALDSRDRALVRAILGAALRRRGEIEAALARCMDRKLPPDSGALSAILHVAAAQILFLDIPDHAAVSLAVTQAAAERRVRNAKGVVNSVLRRLARERNHIRARTDTGRINTPGWLFARWSAAYGEELATEIAEGHLAQPALDLTIARDPQTWAERLGGLLLPTGTVRLAESGRVSALPGYDEGAWWVQDAAAALPARLLGDIAGAQVADLCAAPGGKTAELAVAGAMVTAVDHSPNRLKRLAGNLARLKLQANLEAADILSWVPAQQFDAVLLDAPCSATGTIRRHPDIAWLKRPADITNLAALQARMLDRAASWVRPGGRLVYCTCSLEPEEGEMQVAPFLCRNPGFTLEPLTSGEFVGMDHLITADGTLRTLPAHGFGSDQASPDIGPISRGMDGFFAARFRRAD
jgi:16S rRNA (cytosine967-C5)-methyltransferase